MYIDRERYKENDREREIKKMIERYIEREKDIE